MLARFSVFALVSLSASTYVAALPSSSSWGLLWSRGHAATQCSAGPPQCCKSYEDRRSKAAISKAVPLGYATKMANTDGLVGIDCVSISVGASCSNNIQPACCKESHPYGMISIGCANV